MHESERRRNKEQKDVKRVHSKLATIFSKIQELQNREWEFLDAGEDEHLSNMRTILSQMMHSREGGRR